MQGWGGREARRGCSLLHTQLRNSPTRPGQRCWHPGEGPSVSQPVGVWVLSTVLVAICRFLFSLQSGNGGALPIPSCVPTIWNMPEHVPGTCQNTQPSVLLGFC